MEPSTVTSCALCFASYEAVLEACPACRTTPTADALPHEESFMNTSTCPETDATAAAPSCEPPNAPAATSTLIEFPGAGRNRPQWRKDLSERVREIQQRRALEAARETNEATPMLDATQTSPAADAHTSEAREPAASPLGLVPTPEPQEVNPIVAKALERIERARQQHAQLTLPRSSSRGGAAAAVIARPREESYRAPAELHAPASATELQVAPPSQAESLPVGVIDEQQVEATKQAEATQQVETTRATNLVVVPPAPMPVAASASDPDALIKEALDRPRPRRHLAEVADDALLTRREAEFMPQVANALDDVKERASLVRRVVASLVDLFVVAFAASPFAAIMELTSGNWHDPRVAGSLAGVVVVVMFVYLTASVALTGHTLGMKLLCVRVADERNGLIPSAGQCARRAFCYMLSLALLGAGLLPALFGRQRRALHDRLSGTRVLPAK